MTMADIHLGLTLIHIILLSNIKWGLALIMTLPDIKYRGSAYILKHCQTYTGIQIMTELDLHCGSITACNCSIVTHCQTYTGVQIMTELDLHCWSITACNCSIVTHTSVQTYTVGPSQLVTAPSSHTHILYILTLWVHHSL